MILKLIFEITQQYLDFYFCSFPTFSFSTKSMANVCVPKPENITHLVKHYVSNYYLYPLDQG